MVKKIRIALLSIALLSVIGSQAFADHLQVNQYKVDVPESLYVEYKGENQNVFPKGFKTGFGSALTIKSVGKDGAIEFYMLTDRGPNGDGPKYKLGEEKFDTKYFLSPGFQPQIGIGLFKDGKVTMKGTIGLKNIDGSKITGLPLSPGHVGATNEIALNDAQQMIGYDDNGMDPEGIAVDKDGNIWICDEYGPFIGKFNAEGRLIKKYAPGKGLPEILQYRTPNRGFEGLTITPSGNVVVAEQSILNVEGQTNQTARFTRLVMLDPATGVTKTFAYPIDMTYKSPKDAKIGDIFAVSDTEFLIIEQGKDKDKVMQNLIYKVDISEAEDIAAKQINGQAPEFFENPSIRMAKKELLVDLRKVGWTIEKAEGLTLLPDRQTIAVVNDNDFGLAVKVKDSKNPQAKIGDYVLHKDGAFTYHGKLAKPVVKMEQNSETEREMYLFTIRLPEPLN